MADKASRRSSLDGIRRLQAEGLTRATPSDAPEIELCEEFWRNARIVSTEQPRETSEHRPAEVARPRRLE
ncbi:MAG: hypothetical protein U1E52_01890 [Geminicoccaceae bacterium]